MKIIGLIWIIAMSSQQLLGQWMELGEEETADYPMGLCEDGTGNIYAAMSSVVDPGGNNSDLPYSTTVSGIHPSTGITGQVVINDFIAASLFNWNGTCFLYGSGQTSSGTYSLAMYEIHENLVAIPVFEWFSPDTSLVARTAYVDNQQDLVLLARRFYFGQEDFLTCRLEYPGALQVATTHSGAEMNLEYSIFELPVETAKYIINASNGYKYFLDKNTLEDLTGFSTSMEPMNLNHESTPTVISDSTFMICGDNFALDGFGELSAYVVTRNELGEPQDWFELASEVVELTNHGCGFYFDPVASELFLGLTAIDVPGSSDVPEAKFGLARYATNGNLLGMDIHGEPGMYFSTRKMLRTSSGGFVLAGIKSPAGITADTNELNVFIAFFDQEGILTVKVEIPQGSVPAIRSIGNDTVAIHLGNLSSARFEIVDITGRILFSKTVREGEVRMHGLHGNGIYIARLCEHSKVIAVQKLVLAH